MRGADRNSNRREGDQFIKIRIKKKIVDYKTVKFSPLILYVQYCVSTIIKCAQFP